MTDPDPTAVTSPAARRRRPVALIVVIAVLVTAGVTVAGLYVAGAFSTEVVAEPLASDGVNPFMPAIGEGQPVARPEGKVGVSITGEVAGLYGGTLNNAACDPDKLVRFLQQNPDKAAAWAGVLGITVAGIPAYVGELTPVLLRSDAAVTNHGFADGEATELNSVLEAGTAVLVDTFGVPRVRCKCGNPLTPARTFSRPAYEGDRWAEFDPLNITKVQPAAKGIGTFEIINVKDNRGIIKRPAGSKGDRDEGRLEDASIAGRYTLTRTVVTCNFAEPCLARPMPVEITCASEDQCTVTRTDGVWARAHVLARDGGTWTTRGIDETASYCIRGGPLIPTPGTIEFNVTAVSAAPLDGQWRAVRLQGTYAVSDDGAACNGSGGNALYELSN